MTPTEITAARSLLNLAEVPSDVFALLRAISAANHPPLSPEQLAASIALWNHLGGVPKDWRRRSGRPRQPRKPKITLLYP